MVGTWLIESVTVIITRSSLIVLIFSLGYTHARETSTALDKVQRLWKRWIKPLSLSVFFLFIYLFFD